MENNRNYFVAIALSVLILIAWQFLYINPKIEKERIAAEQTQANPAAGNQTTAGQTSTGQTATGQTPAGAVPGGNESRELAIAKSARVTIDTPALSGSINLTGARLDDLKLKEYHETVDDKSPIITLFSPADSKDGYFTELGYIGNEASGTVPGPATVWSVKSGEKLTPATPVVLTFTNEKGVDFTRTISVDEHFMFQITDTINNGSGAPVSLSSYGRVTRFNKPTTPSIYVLHEGFIGVIGEHGLNEVAYGKVEDEAPIQPGKTTTGWLGITDKYWAATIVPPQATPYEAKFAHFPDGRPRYQADYKQDAITIAPGQSTDLKALVFAGAKQVPLVDGYEKSYSIPQFDLLIDWGWFYFITKPMFKLMDFFFRYFGNFGVAILLTTIVVKALFFPLASKQYASMANMKKVQPKMEELKKKHGDDRMALQQAMMQLYKDEKINPLAGCWPILIQIPV
ncbi:MAG: membrane protein insertase YidC, partial [Rhizobium giardinii]